MDDVKKLQLRINQLELHLQELSKKYSDDLLTRLLEYGFSLNDKEDMTFTTKSGKWKFVLVDDKNKIEIIKLGDEEISLGKTDLTNYYMTTKVIEFFDNLHG